MNVRRWEIRTVAGLARRLGINESATPWRSLHAVGRLWNCDIALHTGNQANNALTANFTPNLPLQGKTLQTRMAVIDGFVFSYGEESCLRFFFPFEPDRSVRI
jgi:hypothetical protein